MLLKEVLHTVRFNSVSLWMNDSHLWNKDSKCYQLQSQSVLVSRGGQKLEDINREGNWKQGLVQRHCIEI